MLPEDIGFSELAQSATADREYQRLQFLNQLGLFNPESVPVFEEATQTAAYFLKAAICVLGVLDRERLWFKSALGLSRIGLMNHLAASRQLPRAEALCTQVIEQQQPLVLSDASADPAFANCLLVQRYGIRAYLGVPVVAANGHCLGALAVMSLKPREFSEQDVAFLELIARWSISEYERDRLLRQSALLDHAIHRDEPSGWMDSPPFLAPASLSIKSSLLAQMTQELCTPLTSILGMAKVLGQGIYGNLSDKQREYIEIIHSSGQYLLSLVHEIVELGNLDDSRRQLTLSPVDIEMLCQQAIGSLNQAAQRREQHIQLTVEPGNRIWLLDKDKVRQLVYHLVFSVIQASSSGSIVRIHVSRKHNSLNLSVWTSHPWLGDGLPPIEMVRRSAPSAASVEAALEPAVADLWDDDDSLLENTEPATYAETALASMPAEASRQNLGLLLSRHLAELHDGTISVQGSLDEGYRYVVRLPQLQSSLERSS
ncbi:MAG: GAF domain-containing sensor histidine kinase [Synechococcales cyanobacterium C42_A2020_086]|jgi:signal transduction histidine kinase|nr:GAF domain-containing sensor histidine kinase [Synechococcales cyanobacterium C42_A2020_086]